MVAGDFNLDGKLDLAVSSSNSVAILLGNGDGTFQPQVTYATSGGGSLATGDFNGDGKPDLAVIGPGVIVGSAVVSVLLGRGDGTFQAPVDYPSGTTPANVIARDVNGDGILDLVVTDSFERSVSILVGKGDGTFKPPLHLGSGTFAQPAELVAGDFNADGAMDLAVADFTGKVAVYLNSMVIAMFPNNLTFANQLLGTASAAQTVTVRNPGPAPLGFSSIVASGDFSQTNNCGTSLAIRLTCGINIIFTPTATGARTGTIKLTDTARTSPHTILLNGTSGASTVTVAPASLTFAGQATGSSSPAQAVTFTNTGTSAVTITSITASGDFAQTNTCGASVAPASSCPINVRFTPTATGARTGTLTITDSDLGSPQTVTLSGTGVAAAPAVALAPISLSFGAQQVGAVSAAQPVTLTNTGNAPLNITSIVASADYAQTNNCGSSVAAGASCTSSVTFTPSAVGSRPGTVIITDNASPATQTISLSGTGVSPRVTLSASALQLPDTHVNQTCLPGAVTITNSGATALTISGITVSGPYTRTTTCPLAPATLAPGASCLITVIFVPTTTGAQTGTLTVTSDALSSPNTVTLAGNAKLPCLVVPAVSALTVIRGADTSTFSLKHQTDGGAAEDPLRMYCTNQAPARCAFDPGLVGPMGTSTLTLSNLQAVHAGLLMFDVHGDAGLDKHTTGLTVLISDFAFSSAPDTATVAAGQSTSFALVAAPQNGLQGTVSLSCSGAPAGATCAVAPSAITLTGAAPVSVTVTVSTTARSLAPPGSSRRVLPLGGNPIGLLVLAVFGILASLAAAKFGAQKSRSLGSLSSTRLRLASLGAGLTMAMVLVWGACGGGGSFSGPPPLHALATPAGTYNLTVTGTYTGAPGTNAQLSHAAVLNLTVN